MSTLLINLAIVILFNCSVDAVVNDRFFPRYHIAPPIGWMNDPNALFIFDNAYHLFYQHNPYSSFSSGIVHWRHAKSKDLFHWEDLGIALYPDQWYDQSGVYSGSGIVENNVIYIYYTANINLSDEYPDHEQHQALVISSDAINFEKYAGNPIINGTNLQPDFRDPKVWKHNNTYYMVLGNSIENGTLGRIILFASNDKINWEQVSILDQSNGKLGYMYECPDFFELDGTFVLLFSPQGVKPEGDKYRNLYQTGYKLFEFDYETNISKSITEFREMDHGHDYYATQTMLDKNGDRVVIAWADMWEQSYPEQTDGFNGQMTLPRILSLTKDRRLLQKPVKQVAAARGEEIYSGKIAGGTVITLNDNAAEVQIKASGLEDLDLYIESQNTSKTVTLNYDYKHGLVTLNRGGIDGMRRTNWKPKGQLYWNIFIDASSIELFCGKGEVTFTSRFFPDGSVKLRVGENNHVDEIRVNNMKRTVYLKN